jgi:hypothetical protein
MLHAMFKAAHLPRTAPAGGKKVRQVLLLRLAKAFRVFTRSLEVRV